MNYRPLGTGKAARKRKSLAWFRAEYNRLGTGSKHTVKGINQEVFRFGFKRK